MDWSDWISAIATVAAAIIALFGLLIAAAATRVNAAMSQRNQQSNVVLHCSLRYDSLYELRSALGEPAKPVLDQNVHNADPKIQNYFNRYFGLESDQIDFWIAGYVDPETIYSWLISLSENLYDHGVGGYRYESGWNFVADRHRVVNRALYNIITQIMNFKSQLNTATMRERETAIAANIVVQMKSVEKSEAKIMWRLSEPNGGRFTAEEFEKYLDSTIQKSISNIENGRSP